MFRSLKLLLIVAITIFAAALMVSVTSELAMAATPAQFTGNTIGIALDPSGNGYWTTTDFGIIRAYDGAENFGSVPGTDLFAPIVGIASSPAVNGYWLVDRNGSVYSFGNARLYGEMSSYKLNAPIVGITVTKDGLGYWLVGKDGGIFAFGDAYFIGAAHNTGSPVVGMGPTYAVDNAYYVADQNGAVVQDYGYKGGETSPIQHLNTTIEGIATIHNSNGSGYYLFSSDGGVFAYGSAHFEGCLVGTHFYGTMTGLATSPLGDNYFVVTSRGTVYNFLQVNKGSIS